MRVTLRFQATGTVPGNAEPVVMQGPSLTIGRGEENDLMLPDPDRLISKRHCSIEDSGGDIVVVDLSTNGTFLNYGKVALGKVPTPLNDGDILTMGPYELLVEIKPDAATGRGKIAAPAESGPVSHGQADLGLQGMGVLDDTGNDDFLDDLLGGGAAPGGPSRVRRAELGDDGLLPPLGDDEMDGLLAPAPEPQDGGGASRSSHSSAMEDHFRPGAASGGVIPDDWDDDLLGGDGAGGDDDPFAVPHTPPPAPRGSRPLIPEEPVLPPAGQGRHGAGAATGGGTDAAAARAFLSALGATEAGIGDAELTATMERLGKVMRIMIEGVREVLMTRSSIKSEFRIHQTMISAGANNPLKFSISADQAVETLVKPAAKGYLAATDAAEEALRDIKAHEVAMMSGMEAALKGILARLSPEVLAGQIETSSGFGSLLKGKKARYWEIYEKMYAEISDQAENDFHELFSKEFARAYQSQLERLK
ncbi:MAG: type VI secretion system-associated FHA domain protein TagH [Rhodobacteraceae bacterium]|nr:type VI secretion system-associated FHA domain protein TagH [Paracoccaceae bacterium]